ncbi:MAG: O-antigen ligase family protein [Anaerolineae bacterium]|nr:O-antigen ligase family protein [Anaerolineae bacterium]MDQ7035747.1 O-antigen ligase family protein [Anaerolineae bacterium]
MRRSRLAYLLLALYFTFIGGGTYYATIPLIRIVHHVIVTLLLGGWLIGRIRKKQGLPPTPLNIAIYASVIVWFITAIFAVDTRMALENIWLLLSHVILCFIIVNLIQRGYQRVVMEILFFMAAIVLLLASIELASWFFGLGITPSTSIGWIAVGRFPTLAQIPRLSLALGISTLQAGYTAPLVIVTAGWAFTTRQRDYRFVLLFMSFLLLIVVILTSSRGGLLSLMAATGSFAVIRLLQYPPLTKHISRMWLAIGSAIAVGILLVGFVFVTLPLAKGNSDSGRLDMYRSAVSISLDNPITGVGVGLFGRTFREYRNPEIAQDKLASAHNLYLNTSAELGLLGIAVGIGILVLFAKATWDNWQNTSNRGHRRRIEIIVSALVGLAVHSMVDVFSITPIVLMILALVAYAIIPHPRSRIVQAPKGQVLPAIIAFILIIGYGIAFIPLDRASGSYFDSWQMESPETALAAIHEAQKLDPNLRLYNLHETYIIGQSGTVDEAIAAYENALELEPTWTTGWINLALLEEERDNPEIALSHLERANTINGRSVAAWFNWGRIAESYDLAPDDLIIEAYRQSIALQASIWLPVSEYWAATSLRQHAVELYLQQQSIEIQYRVYAVHDPSRLTNLVPDMPQSAAEWWVVGEYALSIENDPETAYEAFSQAIELNPYHGDYFVSRARTTIENNPNQAEQDALVGLVLGTRYEYPNVVLASFAEDPETARNLRAGALPLRSNPPQFTTVLYGRPSVFDILPSGYPPGHGGQTIQPWLDVAFSYLETNQINRARTAFAFILSQAPYNSIAQEQLDLLQDSPDL